MRAPRVVLIFFVESVTDTPAGVTYPRVETVTLDLNAVVDSNFLSDELKQAAMRLRAQYATYYAGNNGWKQDPRTGAYSARKALAPDWGIQEIEIVSLLINADTKFKKSWNEILQYALVDRPETASSGYWYKLRGKESYKREYFGQGLSKQR